MRQNPGPHSQTQLTKSPIMTGCSSLSFNMNYFHCMKCLNCRLTSTNKMLKRRKALRVKTFERTDLHLSSFSTSFEKENVLKVGRDSCDVTHSLTQASIHTSHVHGSKSCTKYSLHLVQSRSRHTNVIMLYAVKCSLYVVGQGYCKKVGLQGVKMWQSCLVCQNEPGNIWFVFR